jgi:uncharacterized protein (DUF1810 family)
MQFLDRFKEAQARDFEVALGELRSGRKSSHWIWFIFPQLESLGFSTTAKFYGLRGVDEACDYLRDALLCERLFLVTRAVVEQLTRGVRLEVLMGGVPDVLKIISSLTLFQAAARRLEAIDADLVWTQFIALSEVALQAAEREGFSRCWVTRKSIEQASGFFRR